MDWDEVRSKNDNTTLVGESLERLSVGELEVRIGVLEQEIERVRDELAQKKKHEAQAADLFKN